MTSAPCTSTTWPPAGAPNLDAECTSTTMRDYLRARDLTHLPEELVARYDDGTAIRGVLVFKPGS